MKRSRPLILLLVIVLLISLSPLQSRWQQEEENSRVELIMDLYELDKLQVAYPDFSLADLQEAGVTGAATLPGLWRI